jgi:hypothetical protein
MIRSTLTLCCLLLACKASALQKHAPVKAAPPEAQPTTVEVKNGADSYSYKVVPFNEWQNGVEKRVLNLYPSFRDGAAQPGWQAAPSTEVVLFIATATAVLDRPAESVNFQALMNLEMVAHLQEGLATVKGIAADDVETFKPKNQFLTYRNPPDQHWCARATPSICFESEFVFDGLTELAFAGLMMTRLSLDTELRAQSELQFEHPTDAAQINDLKQLTGVSSVPAGVIVQNIFWFNHVMEFGKVVGIVQPHPSSAQKSILTGYSLFAVERKWWDKSFRGARLSDSFLGKHLNTQTGLAMGFPKVTEQIFKAMSGILSH